MVRHITQHIVHEITKEIKSLPVVQVLPYNWWDTGCSRSWACQTYDGSISMFWMMQGVQVHFKKEQLLAMYVPCGPHCVNLITHAASVSFPIKREAMHLVHELGVLFNQSRKFKAIFTAIANSDHTSLKPLSPTRWTARMAAMCSVLTQNESVLTATDESIMLEMSVLKEMNIFLQQRSQTTSGMLAAVESQIWRELWLAVLHSILGYNISKSASHQDVFEVLHWSSHTISSFYCTSVQQKYWLFQPGQASKAAKIRRHTHLWEDWCSHRWIPRVEYHAFWSAAELEMLQANYTCTTSSDVSDIFQEMVPEVQHLFKQVKEFLRLMVVPASAEAEWSCSALRWLKTWLRTTMTRTRLNNIAMCINRNGMRWTENKSVRA